MDEQVNAERKGTKRRRKNRKRNLYISISGVDGVVDDHVIFLPLHTIPILGDTRLPFSARDILDYTYIQSWHNLRCKSIRTNVKTYCVRTEGTRILISSLMDRAQLVL